MGRSSVSKAKVGALHRCLKAACLSTYYAHSTDDPVHGRLVWDIVPAGEVKAPDPRECLSIEQLGSVLLLQVRRCVFVERSVTSRERANQLPGFRLTRLKHVSIVDHEKTLCMLSNAGESCV
jgi:hypothetical protein